MSTSDWAFGIIGWTRPLISLGISGGGANLKNTTTVYRGLELFPFDARRDERKMIASERLEQDARSAATDVLEMLLSDGLEFFNRYSDLQECSVGLNAPIKARTHQLCNNFPLRAYYGVVAAALTQPERVPSLIQSYVDFALQSGAAEMMMYEVGKELSGVDAIALRLKFLSEIARATSL